jgi:hypothetical protein
MFGLLGAKEPSTDSADHGRDLETLGLDAYR